MGPIYTENAAVCLTGTRRARVRPGARGGARITNDPALDGSWPYMILAPATLSLVMRPTTVTCSLVNSTPHTSPLPAHHELQSPFANAMTPSRRRCVDGYAIVGAISNISGRLRPAGV